MNRIKVIYKTRDTGMKNGMQVMRGTRGMFTWILGNLLEDSGNVLILAFRGMLEKIQGNSPEDSGECSGRFWGMFRKIPGNIQEDSGKSKF